MPVARLDPVGSGGSPAGAPAGRLSLAEESGPAPANGPRGGSAQAQCERAGQRTAIDVEEGQVVAGGAAHPREREVGGFPV